MVNRIRIRRRSQTDQRADFHSVPRIKLSSLISCTKPDAVVETPLRDYADAENELFSPRKLYSTRTVSARKLACKFSHFNLVVGSSASGHWPARRGPAWLYCIIIT